MKKKSLPAAESASLHPNRVLHPHAGDLVVHEAAKDAPAGLPGRGARAVASADVRPVTLVCQAPGAREVYLAGDFNGWQPRTTPMVRQADGRWTATLPLPPGPHEYRFVVDGQWQEDPQAARAVPNPFGGCNSVLEVRPAARPQP